MDQEIGRKLKRIRTQRGVSQRQLARISGVANATISQIEAGRLNPTVGLLKKVLDGIPVSLAGFFAADDDGPERVFYRADELTEIADGGVSYRQVGAHLDDRALQLLKERYEPGSGTGKHALTHAGEECGIILSGRLRVSVGDQVATLRAGDAYYFKSHQPHHFHNPGSERCELVSVCTPPSF